MSRKKSWVPYAVAAGAAALLVLFAMANRDRLRPVVPGRKAPNFAAFDLQGIPKSLDDYEGKVLLLNVWATWCPPCMEEIPSMQRLYDQIADDEFEIVAVSIDAPFGERDAFGRVGGDLKTFVQTRGLSFTVLHDPTGRIQETFQTTGVPESFVVDKDGVIFKKVAGATAWDAPQNVELIQRLLGG